MKKKQINTVPVTTQAEQLENYQLATPLESPSENLIDNYHSTKAEHALATNVAQDYPSEGEQEEPLSDGDSEESERAAREEMERLLKNRLAAEDAARELIRQEAERAAGKLKVEETDDASPDPDKLSGGNRRRRMWPIAAMIAIVVAGVFGVFVFAAGGVFRMQKVDVSATDTQRSDKNRREERAAADAATMKLIENARQQANAQQPPVQQSSSGQTGAQTGNSHNSAGQPSATPNGMTATQNAGSLAPYTYSATGGNASGTIPSSNINKTAKGADGTNAGFETNSQDAHTENGPSNKSSASSSSSNPSNKEREQIAKLPSSSESSQEPFLYVPASSVAKRPAQFASAATSSEQSSRNRKPGFAHSAAATANTPTAYDAAPVVPPFGTMLPVRTLGALYTLRSQGSVRLELTRDVEGRGWSLRRGTVLIGQLQGADADRAFVRIAGYIDPQVNKLVAFGGVTKGIDGGDGFKGKRRVVGSAWTRALARIGERAANFAQSWLSGKNGGTTIVMGGNQPAIAELDGLEQRERRPEFVEVAAGTEGYVMIIDLPQEVEGQVPTSLEMPGDEETLSETEIAHLLTVGTPDEIRASMSKMSPEMRRIAADVLKAAN